LHVSLSDKTLIIYLEENRMVSYNGEFRVEITTPILDEIVLQSVLDAKMVGFEDMYVFSARLYSSSKLEGDLVATVVELQVFTLSEVTLTGSADQVTIRAGEAGKINLIEFPVRIAFLDVRSASIVSLSVQEQMEVNAVEDSKIFYLGSPSIDAEVDGTSHLAPLE
jgi:hypothetical protein